MPGGGARHGPPPLPPSASLLSNPSLGEGLWSWDCLGSDACCSNGCFHTGPFHTEVGQDTEWCQVCIHLQVLTWPLEVVLVHVDWRDKISQTRWLQQQFTSHGSGGWEIQDQGAGRFSV